MSKITLQSIANLDNPNTVIAQLNSNFVILQAIVDLLLSRDGESPNAMVSNLDMNGNRILNLPEPTTTTEPARHGDLQQYVDEAIEQVALAADQVSLATTQAGIATDKAEDATEKDNDVVTKWTDFLNRYVGAYAEAPSIDAAGNPISIGSMYFDTETNTFHIYNIDQIVSNGNTVISNGLYVKIAEWFGYPQTTLLSLNDVNASSITGGQTLIWNDGAEDFVPFDLSSYDISIYVEGLMNNGESLFRFVAVRPFTMPVSMEDSVAVARVPPNATTVISLQRNGSEIGTVTFAATETSGTFSIASEVTFQSGDILTLAAPNNPDTTLQDVAFTLVTRRAN